VEILFPRPNWREPSYSPGENGRSEGSHLVRYCYSIRELPKAPLSKVSPLVYGQRRVFFGHWSPKISAEGQLLSDEGLVVGKSDVAGQFIASLRARGGSCGEWGFLL
jgi:hypothetical protein